MGDFNSEIQLLRFPCRRETLVLGRVFPIEGTAGAKVQRIGGPQRVRTTGEPRSLAIKVTLSWLWMF